MKKCVLVSGGAGFIGSHVSVELIEGGSPRLLDRLRRRELDLTFSCDPAALKEFEHVPAFSDRVLLAVPKDALLPKELKSARLSAADVLAGRHLSPDCPCAPLSAFADQDFILLEAGNNLRERSLAMLDEAGIAPRVTMTLSQLVTTFEMAENGLGAAFVSDRLVRSPRAKLDFFRLASPLAVREFFILLPERAYTPFAVRAFAGYALRKIRENDRKRGRTGAGTNV